MQVSGTLLLAAATCRLLPAVVFMQVYKPKPQLSALLTASSSSVLERRPAIHFQP